MISAADKEFIDKLDAIGKDLSKYKNMSKDELFNYCIDKRLKATLLQYNEDLDGTSSYLLRKAGWRVLRSLTRMQKTEDKDIIQKHLKKNIKKEEA